MDLSDDELQQDAEQIAKEVDPSMLMEMATWSKAGQLMMGERMAALLGSRTWWSWPSMVDQSR
jgi:hypothetical protein